MSSRHERDPRLDPFEQHVGSVLVPSMGWVGSVVPGGRHAKCDDCPFEDGKRCNKRATECWP